MSIGLSTVRLAHVLELLLAQLEPCERGQSGPVIQMTMYHDKPIKRHQGRGTMVQHATRFLRAST